MPSFTYKGTNASGYDYRGDYVFPPGKPVAVTDPDMVRRLRQNVEYEVNNLDHDAVGGSGGSLADSPPSLTGKNKARLLKIAASEGVEIEDGATNKQIVKAIERERNR